MCTEERETKVKKPLFTFAVTTDSHIMLDEGDFSTAYESSRKFHNGRTRYLIEELNRLSPDFVINLGDVVQPVPSLPTYGPANQEAKKIFENLQPKMYSSPGNHDIGDKLAGWMPGPKVSSEFINTYEKYWGKSYQSFDYQGIHFILINTPVINSGLPEEGEQREWLEKDLEANKDKRIFMFTHYPMYLRYPDEEEHYDNIAEPGRSWLLDLLACYNVENLYAGHVHNFFYNEFGKTKQYVLPALSFVRPDYSELFHVDCAPSHGRNDIYKFGFFIVKVYEDTHENQYVRTFGRTLEKGELPRDKKVIGSNNIMESPAAPIGVYLRHSWAENHIIPFGNLDEFGRKVVREDFQLQALWDLGIKKIRIPVGDLYLSSTLDRIKSLKAMGHEFTLFTTGVPNEKTKSTIINYQDLIDVWEITLSLQDMKEAIVEVEEVKKKASIETYLSKIETSASQQKGEEAKFHHFIRHGFDAKDGEEILNLYENGNLGIFDGLIFSIKPEQSPYEEMLQAKELCNKYNVALSIHIQMRGAESPAVENRDDKAIANRIAEIVVASYALGRIKIFLDTFADHDRGFFIRNGLIDRRSNPRLQYHVFKYLSSLLQQVNISKMEVSESSNGEWKQINFESGPHTLKLILPGNGVENVEGIGGDNHIINLKTGEVHEESMAQNQLSVPVLIVNQETLKKLEMEGSRSGAKKL